MRFDSRGQMNVPTHSIAEIRERIKGKEREKKKEIFASLTIGTIENTRMVVLDFVFMLRVERFNSFLFKLLAFRDLCLSLSRSDSRRILIFYRRS